MKPFLMARLGPRRGSWPAILILGLASLSLAGLAGCRGAGSRPTPTASIGTREVPALDPAFRPRPGRPWTNSLGLRLVPVSATAVWFAVWETRVQDFAAFAEATHHEAGSPMYGLVSNRWELLPDRSWRNPGFPQEGTHPVVGVSWEDARAFCRWLTTREQGLGLLTPRQRYRLPTDLEWSRAVGLEPEVGRTPQERFVQVRDVYPWGSPSPPPPGVGNLHPSLGLDPYERTAPVGHFAPNPFGLHDLVGNVIEWCEDWWNEQQIYRVLRGSGWHTDCPSCLLSSYRYPNFPDLRVDYYGFRVVLEPQPAP